jgi:hypothetical protein
MESFFISEMGSLWVSEGEEVTAEDSEVMGISELAKQASVEEPGTPSSDLKYVWYEQPEQCGIEGLLLRTGDSCSLHRDSCITDWGSSE